MPHDNDEIDSGDTDAGDDRFDLYEIIGDSNNGAYQRTEQRTGPPLVYVAEKSRHALEQIHTAYRSIGDGTGDRGATQAAFHYSLLSYLALSNMLSLAADHGVVERLLAMPPGGLSKWLDAVDAEGSVTG
jgi:hypothetical protein